MGAQRMPMYSVPEDSAARSQDLWPLMCPASCCTKAGQGESRVSEQVRGEETSFSSQHG